MRSPMAVSEAVAVEEKVKGRKEFEKKEAAIDATLWDKTCKSLKTRWKNRRRRKEAKYAEDPQQRTKIEEEESKRWAAEVAEVIEEARLPRYYKAQECLQTEAAMQRCTGTARAKTTRQRIRTWRKVRSWMLQVHKIPWPAKPSQFVDYVQDLYELRCPRTVPQSSLDAVGFFGDGR